jgi:hypothetical protein
MIAAWVYSTKWLNGAVNALLLFHVTATAKEDFNRVDVSSAIRDGVRLYLAPAALVAFRQVVYIHHRTPPKIGVRAKLAPPA